MSRLSFRLLVCMFLALTFVTVLSTMRFDKPSYKEPLSELRIGTGIGPDMMANQVSQRTGDSNALLALIEDGIDQSEWRSGPSLTVTVTVGCTAEDIFGSREAYLAFFGNEEGAQSVDETPSDSIDK